MSRGNGMSRHTVAVAAIQRVREESRERFLTLEEMKRLRHSRGTRLRATRCAIATPRMADTSSRVAAMGIRKSLRLRVLPGRRSLRYNAHEPMGVRGDATWIRQEPSGNTYGKRLAAFAGTAEHGYTYGRTLTTSSKSGSCSRSTICTLACMGAAVVRIRCRRVSTVTRTRAGGASNNFGNGFGHLARRKAPFLRPGRSMRKV